MANIFNNNKKYEKIRKQLVDKSNGTYIKDRLIVLPIVPLKFVRIKTKNSTFVK